MVTKIKKHRNIGQNKRRRTGAIISTELMLTLPLLIGIFFAAVEFGILLVSFQKIENGCREACRVGTLPGATYETVDQTLRDSLGWNVLSSSVTIEDLSLGRQTGDRVELQVSVPMKKVAPDMLGFIGFSLGERQLHSHCSMRKE